MTTLLLPLLLFCQTSSFQSATAQKEINLSLDSITIENKINSIRDTLQLDGLIVDSVLNQASELIDLKEPSKLEKVSSQNQACIIKLLRKSHIFDYEIRCIVLEGNSAGEIDVENNADLKSVISNPSFNRMGFSLKKEGSKTEVRLILTQHFIQFPLHFDYESSIGEGAGGVRYRINGISNVDSLYYQSTQLDELPDSFVPSSMTNIEFEDSDYYRQEYESDKQWIDIARPLLKEKLQNDELNYFELLLNGPAGNIVFMDSKGKILAFVHFNRGNSK
jgi:hypothetical protein